MVCICEKGKLRGDYETSFVQLLKYYEIYTQAFNLSASSVSSVRMWLNSSCCDFESHYLDS